MLTVLESEGLSVCVVVGLTSAGSLSSTSGPSSSSSEITCYLQNNRDLNPYLFNLNFNSFETQECTQICGKGQGEAHCRVLFSF